jgi:hypothetical protein
VLLAATVFLAALSASASVARDLHMVMLQPAWEQTWVEVLGVMLLRVSAATLMAMHLEASVLV